MLRWCRRWWRARPCKFRAGGTSPHQLGDIIQQNILGVTVAMESVQKSKKATITVLGTCVRCVESSTWATGRWPVTSRFLRLFFFLALIVSLLSSSFSSWLVGVFLNRHHILMLRQKHYSSIFRRTALQLRSLQQLQQQVGDRQPSRLRYR